MEKPLVIQLITRFIRGGAQLAVLQLLEKLPDFGYEVLLATGPETGKEGNLFGEAKARGIPLKVIPSLRRDVSPLLDICALFEIIKLLRERKPTILHTHTSKAGFLGRIAGRICKVPVVIYQPRGHIFDGYFSPFKTRIFWLLEKIALNKCDAFVCLTEEERRDWRRWGFSHPFMPIIHSGVDIQRFSKPRKPPAVLRRELEIREGTKVVGYVGRLAPVKGARYLLFAGEILMKNHKDLLLLFVGDGEEREELERIARERGFAERTIFLGHREDIADFYHIIDVLVVPSLNEGFGRVIVEAWASGKPVVGSAVGGIRELIDDGETGLLVPPESPPELADAIEKVLEDEDLAGRLGGKGREKARRYSVEEMVRKTAELYRSCLERKRKIQREGGRYLSRMK